MCAGVIVMTGLFLILPVISINIYTARYYFCMPVFNRPKTIAHTIKRFATARLKGRPIDKDIKNQNRYRLNICLPQYAYLQCIPEHVKQSTSSEYLSRVPAPPYILPNVLLRKAR